MTPQDQSEQLRQALGLFGQNQIESSIKALEGILRVEPNHPVALHFLGLCQHRQGQSEAGLEFLQRSVELDPNCAAFHSNLGLFFAERNDLDRAVGAFSKALCLDPSSAQTHSNLGNLLQRQGKCREAIACFESALKIDPGFVQALNNLAGAMASAGRIDEAIRAFEKALTLAPTIAEIHFNLGNLLLSQAKHELAMARFREALRLKPAYPDALIGAARAHKAQGDTASAVEQLRRALEAQPSNANGYLELGHVLRESGRFPEALDCFSKAANIAPANFYAQWNSCLALPVIYENADEIRVHRARWQAGVGKLLDFVRSPSGAASVRGLFAAPHTNFYLHYQGCNDLAEQKEFASIVSSLAAHVGTELPVPACVPWTAGTSKIKVGFASCFFSLHTIFKLFHGWIRHLRRDLFESHVFHLGKDFDKASEFVGENSGYFFAQFRSPREMIERIRASELDVLIYPELGMDPVTLGLAALRLAPIQCMAWGHPVTSGLPTIDYFLSSELMEGPEALSVETRAGSPKPNIALGASESGRASSSRRAEPERLPQDRLAGTDSPYQKMREGGEGSGQLPNSSIPVASPHYSEKLVPLPNLSICYPPPDTSIAQSPEGLDAGSRGKTCFLCLQSLFKLLPQYDDLYPRIARQTPNCQFWFIALESSGLTDLFRRRLTNAFQKHGLDATEYVRVFPKMKIGAFFGLVRESDVILDSIGWSGGNTTLEAIAFDKPVVTLPGELMRSRHSAAILTRMGITETIASDLEGYVRIAVRLAVDRLWRAQIVSSINRSKQRVYNDLDAVRGLERFLVDAISKANRKS